jgi:hypothetical protein
VDFYFTEFFFVTTTKISLKLSESGIKSGGNVHNMTHRNSISLRWVAYEELVQKTESDSDDDENHAKHGSESTENEVKKTEEDESSEQNTEDDVSESAEFEDEGTMKRQINKSEKLSKYFLIFSMNINLFRRRGGRRRRRTFLC